MMSDKPKADQPDLPKLRINKFHMQAIRNDELVFGDQLLIHKEMSLPKINYISSRLASSLISMNIEPFDSKVTMDSP